LRTAEADLILLQEVDLNVRRTQYRDITSELARSLRLNYAFGKEFRELSSGAQASPAHHGLATLSPWPLSNARVIRFQRQSNFWSPSWFIPKTELFQRRLGDRIALVTEVLIYTHRLMTYNLHLESKGKDVLRVQQLSEALADARRYTKSSLVILGGDFNLNAGNGDAAARLHDAGFHDAVRLPQLATASAHFPFQHPRPGVRASDHHPVPATFAIS
jgi:endonuclease/exonuclease/phosphatase family metal-dependent hydrolase